MVRRNFRKHPLAELFFVADHQGSSNFKSMKFTICDVFRVFRRQNSLEFFVLASSAVQPRHIYENQKPFIRDLAVGQKESLQDCTKARKDGRWKRIPKEKTSENLRSHQVFEVVWAQMCDGMQLRNMTNIIINNYTDTAYGRLRHCWFHCCLLVELLATSRTMRRKHFST